MKSKVVGVWVFEAVRFYIAITPRWRLWPTRAFLHWRLGTVYGSFDATTGKPRRLRALFADLWRDREAVIRFLKWRRAMRLRASRGGSL